ncbi:hypothetical protein BKA64DRAFT_713598 [Cadophora sp. MPI-SDFR-AT-0126]|nr:hypothetical protein BKA64DRAFT_713598 [Leotiomycetes sp. MPI-SDFR-AT-0126]
MAENTTASVVPPWGYDTLSSQDAVQATWKSQIFGSIILGGYFWDVIISAVRDGEFVFRRRFNYVTAIFIINRISCIITLTNNWLFAIYTGNQCLAVYKLTVISEPITIFTSQALLLIRVQILYKNNYLLLGFMTLFLFASPVLDLTYAFITTAYNTPGNVGCVFGPSSPYIYLVFLLQALFDCLCFALCTFKLWSMGQGGGLLSIGQEMLNGGLVYYIPNVLAQLATVMTSVQTGSTDQYLLPPLADGVASAQALRITRGLWKKGQDLERRLTDSTDLSPYSGRSEPSREKIESQKTARETV